MFAKAAKIAACAMSKCRYPVVALLYKNHPIHRADGFCVKKEW